MDPSSFEDFSHVVVFLELRDYGLPFEPIDLSKVQASTDVVIDQPFCPSFIIFQPTCLIVIVGLTYRFQHDVVVGRTFCPILDVTATTTECDASFVLHCDSPCANNFFTKP